MLGVLNWCRRCTQDDPQARERETLQGERPCTVELSLPCSQKHLRHGISQGSWHCSQFPAILQEPPQAEQEHCTAISMRTPAPTTIDLIDLQYSCSQHSVHAVDLRDEMMQSSSCNMSFEICPCQGHAGSPLRLDIADLDSDPCGRHQARGTASICTLSHLAMAQRGRLTECQGPCSILTNIAISWRALDATGEALHICENYKHMKYMS